MHKIKKWLGDNIDKRVGKVLGIMNLATRKEVTNLTTTINSLTIKIKKLERLQAAKARAPKKAQREKVKKAEDLIIQKAVKQERLKTSNQLEVHQSAAAPIVK